MTSTTSRTRGPASTPPPPPGSRPPSASPSASPSGGPRARHTARWVAAIVGAVVLLFVGLLATRKPADRARADSPLLGRPAPLTSGGSITFAPPKDVGTTATSAEADGSGGSADATGPMVSLASFKGRYVLVNFFASWCVPCQDEQPALKLFNDRHTAAGDAGVFGVVFDDKADNVRDFLNEHGGGWPVVDSSQAKVDWGVRGVPESFLVDPDGFVLYHIVGGVKTADLETLLTQAKQVRRP